MIQVRCLAFIRGPIVAECCWVASIEREEIASCVTRVGSSLRPGEELLLAASNFDSI